MAYATPPQVASATIASLRFVHGADLSPDGRRVVWSRSRIDDTSEPIDLLLTTVGSTDAETLVAEGACTDPEFSPDGSRIAYLHDDGDAANICVIDLEIREVSALTSFPQGVDSGPRWSPDGQSIAFTVAPPPPESSTPYRVTRAIGWLDGVGLVQNAVNDIYVLDVRTGESMRLTHEDSMIASVQWHADSSRLSYIVSSSPDDWYHDGRVCTVDLQGDRHEVVRLDEIFSVAVHGDRIVGTSAGPSLRGTEILGRLFTIGDDGTLDVRSDGVDVNGDVIADLPIPFADPVPVLHLHGSDALVRAQTGDRLEIHRVALDGPVATRVEVGQDGASAYPIAVRGDRMLYAIGDRLSAPDLWVRDLTTGDDARVTDTARENAGRLTPLRVEHLTARATDGPAVQTTFLAAADSSGPLPTVLLIHGGPESTFGAAMFLDAQLLCEAGFGVLMANPRGSRGYGDDFLTAIRGEWGTKDAADLLAAVDVAIEHGLADPDRLGVSGLSYGGYMTTWLIGQTDRFRAAVAENPVTNFISMYGTSDIGLTFTPQLMDGRITEVFDRYVRSSPITHAERVTTPTLLIVSEDDHRCPPEQALQFYSRLKSTGCAAELVLLPGASHAGAVNESPVIRRAQNDALVEWMTRHLFTAAHIEMERS